MIVVLSPAKSLDMSSYKLDRSYLSEPLFLEDIFLIRDIMKRYNSDSLSSLMKTSKKLAELNLKRYKDFDSKFTYKNAKPAILAFKGDVYKSMDVENYTTDDFNFAQNYLRILSGLYGILRPLDLIQPYRLEMSTKVSIDGYKDLYQFWSSKISSHLNDISKNEQILINLASSEYSEVIDHQLFKGKIIDVIFKDYKQDSYKIVGILAKRARGMMANFIIKNKVTNYQDLKSFCSQGYKFDRGASSDSRYVFLRRSRA